MKYVDELDLAGRRVLLRVDSDFPSQEDKQPFEAKLRRMLPTIQHVLAQGGSLVLAGHWNAPKGRNEQYSLKPLAEKLTEALKQEVGFAAALPEARERSRSLAAGGVLLLENLTFWKEEEKNDLAFARELAALGDVYVNDSFASSDRIFASTSAVPAVAREKAAGLLIKTELDYYERAIVNPKRPLCVALGGANAGPRLEILRNLAQKADKLLVGGALASTFLAAQGLQMGRSMIERDLYPRVLELIGMLARRDCKVYFPVDFRTGDSPKSKGLVRNVPAQEVPPDSMVLDIGPATSILFQEAITNAETIVWNGPMGTLENEDYAQGTTDLIQALASAHGLTFAGGAATEAAVRMMELEHKFDHLSTGGAAFLVLLEGKQLPALSALGWRNR